MGDYRELNLPLCSFGVGLAGLLHRAPGLSADIPPGQSEDGLYPVSCLLSLPFTFRNLVLEVGVAGWREDATIYRDARAFCSFLSAGARDEAGHDVRTAASLGPRKNNGLVRLG